MGVWELAVFPAVANQPLDMALADCACGPAAAVAYFIESTLGLDGTMKSPPSASC